MSDLDARYVAARHVLLDVLLALNPHLHAVVVVGDMPYICAPATPVSRSLLSPPTPT